MKFNQSISAMENELRQRKVEVFSHKRGLYNDTLFFKSTKNNIYAIRLWTNAFLGGQSQGWGVFSVTDDKVDIRYMTFSKALNFASELAFKN